MPLPRARLPTIGARGFLVSAVLLAALPLVPELWLFSANQADLKGYIPICYYECIVSFLIVIPSFFFGRRFSQAWVIGWGAVLAVSTLVVATQAATTHARWDITAHTALMETTVGQSREYLDAFLTARLAVGLSALLLAFAACVFCNVTAARPGRGVALGLLAAGLLGSSYGISHFIRYEGTPIRVTPLAHGRSLRLAGIGINSFHPVPLLLLTHLNYCWTHAYYRESYAHDNRRAELLGGAVPIPGAECPRVMVVVIGESANRLHWSLYGYSRPTTPELESRREELLVFHDIISTSVGTLMQFRSMFGTRDSALPVFPLFSAAGYSTHWLSAHYSQGMDADVVSLVQACQHKQFLNGAYDENLVPWVAKVVESPGRHVLFVNLLGSHVRYEDRYPRQFARFHGQGEKEQRVAAYDNSICYTDHVLSELIELLRRPDEANCLLYVSDHGEDVYDSRPDQYLFRSDSLATDPMYEVPFLIWCSPSYRERNAEFVRRIATAGWEKGQTTELYHSLIDLARLTHPLYDERLSLFSARYAPPERHVGVAHRPFDSAAIR